MEIRTPKRILWGLPSGREKWLLPHSGGLHSVLTANASIISLWGMLWTFVHLFRAALEALGRVRMAVPAYQAGALKFDTKQSKDLKDLLDYLYNVSGVVQLEGTQHLAHDLSKKVKPGMNLGELDAKIDSIQSLARKELTDRKFLYVPNERAEFYDNKSICGALVAEKFPGAVPEIIEAGNCYALERPTACVFHLMRIIPYGMAAVAKLLQVKYTQPITSLDWLSIIQPIEKAIKAIQQTARTPKKIRDIKDFSEIATHLHFCKDAWRNHVSHSPEQYDMPQAKSVMEHVTLVMELVSKRFKKPFNLR